MFSGPINTIKTVLPLGEFMVFAEIYEEAGAFTRFMIKETIHILLPDETEFNAFNFAEKIEAAKFNGDKVRLAQLLTAEV